MENNTEKIKAFFDEHSEAAVAFSGGVDSAVLLLLAKRYAKRVKAYFVKSQFQPQFELDDALEIADKLGADMQVINVDILSSQRVRENPENRCYYCKGEIFSTITKRALSDGFGCVLDGTNASDDIGDRPGFKALQELKVLSPLKACGFTKEQIRRIAKENLLPVADKPSYACLATRIPANTPISGEALELTERAENEMRELGFKNFRLRFNEGGVKIELGKSDLARFNEIKERVNSTLLKYYDNVYPDIKERADE